MGLGTSPLDRRPRRAPEPPDQRDGTPVEREPDADPVEAARAICLRLLTGRDRTRAELDAALARRGVTPEVSEVVLDRLVEVGLVNDTAYAATYVETRHRQRGLARSALSAELRRRGVDDADIEAAVAELPAEQEAQTAVALATRKLASTRNLDEATRVRRAAGQLQRKGYPMGVAMKAIRDALDAERAADG